MSEWGYVAFAYVLVFGVLAGYTLLLARRVTQAQEVEEALREDAGRDEGEDVVCDGHPVP